MSRAKAASTGAVQTTFLDVPATPDVGSVGAKPSRIRVGTASWTDPTLLRSGWYPVGVTDAAGRLRHYASRFNIVESDAPYYAIPTPTVASLWIDRTPRSFGFNIKAHALLTGHRTDPSRLPVSVRQLLQTTVRGVPSVGSVDLTKEALQAIRDTFSAFVAPLRQAGRLGTVLFQYPRWFVPGDRADATLDAVRRDFPELPVAVEFRNASWGEPVVFRETAARLRALGMAFVAVDAPRGVESAMPPVDAVTHPRVAILRLHGRNVAAWEARHTSAATRFDYRYDDDQLAHEIAPRAQRLAALADEVHVIFNNCHEDDGVRNATTLASLVASLPAT
jgi:uncharacterized protein YecE (DUF72 family)